MSALVPTYERPDMLRRALDSALGQELTTVEILVGDDSTSDATAELIDTYDDPRIRYHRNRPALGAQANWLDLASRARTPLVASLHDDDLWDPSFLAATVPPMLADQSIAMTFCDFWIIDAEGRRLEEFTEHESRRTHRSVLPAGRCQKDRADLIRLVAVWNAPQPAYAAVLRRDDVVACEFPEAVTPLYDIWFSYEMVRRGRPIRYEPRRLTSYRIHSTSATSAGFASAEDEVFGRIIAENGDQRQVVHEIRRYWAGLRWARATRIMRSGGTRAASQRELVLAAQDLRGPKRMAAHAGGRSALAWHGLRLAKRWMHDDHGAAIGPSHE